METIVKCSIEKLAFPVDGYTYNVMEWRSVDGGEVFAYCGHGRYCRTLHEAEQYAESVDGTPRTAPRMFAIYKRDLIRTAEISGRPQELRYNCIQYLCQFCLMIAASAQRKTPQIAQRSTKPQGGLENGNATYQQSRL